MNMENMPHPIPYQGSKRKLASTILASFPEGVPLLMEPFAGSAAVSIAAICSRRVTRVHLNDINRPLIRLWDMIIHYPETIAGQYENMWSEQRGKEHQFYDFVRERFNRTKEPADFLYLLARCVKASIRYNTCGEFNQSPDNRRRGMHPDTMKWHILRTSQILDGKVILSSDDYFDVLTQASPFDIIYMDPPYQGVCGAMDPRYFNCFSFDRFVSALRYLNEKSISYIVSYDGRTGTKEFGKKLPDFLELKHVEIHAGRSSQATLLGRDDETYESLYISPALISRLALHDSSPISSGTNQLCLFERVS